MDHPARSRTSRLGTQVLATLAGCWHPVVIILLLISFFTTVSGKPLDGVLMLAVGGALAWDAGQRRRARAAAAGAGPGPAASTGTADPGPVPAAGRGGRARAVRWLAGRRGQRAAAGPETPEAEWPGTVTLRLRTARARPVVPTPPQAAQADSLSAGPAAAGRRRWPLAAAGLLAGALYCLVVGSFTRYSWPATIGVVAVGAAVVSRGWHGPVRHRPVPGPLPRAGTAVWAGLLVAGGLWELSALLQQPSLSTGSYAHPTISVLTDPLLAGPPGRALVLAAWLALGWALVRR
ncbi:MAG: hypothetical protein ACM32E_01890 [Gemmatimonadota bacterium]